MNLLLRYFVILESGATRDLRGDFTDLLDPVSFFIKNKINVLYLSSASDLARCQLSRAFKPSNWQEENQLAIFVSIHNDLH